ncbi:hypothetical protein RFI_14112, partial [Reticulomyxa filosa]
MAENPKDKSQQDVVDLVKKMASSSSTAKQCAIKAGLDIVNVSWEDTARNKKSCWGPNISDMTLQVDKTRMPVIRYSNFSDKTWDVRMEKIPLVVGNEQLLEPGSSKKETFKTITLSDYLKNFQDYMTYTMKDDQSSKRVEMNLLNEKEDTHVIMSAQCCMLPISTGDSQELPFNVSIFNYQACPTSPSVLTIVSTSKGTSAQLILHRNQRLFFNKHGAKADFLGQRLAEHRKADSSDEKKTEGEMTNKEKQQNVVAIIQVPVLPDQSKMIELIVKTLTNKVFSVFVLPATTIMEVKMKVTDKEGIPVEQQRLMVFGIEMKDNHTIADYKLQTGHIICLVLRLRGGCFFAGTQ